MRLVWWIFNNFVIIVWHFSTTRKIQIPLGFPSEHPYTSHMPKFQVFPSLESPDDIRKGKQAVMLQPTLPPTAPASAPDPTVLEKTKGHFDRREMVSIKRESERKPLTWPEHNLLQVIPTNWTCTINENKHETKFFVVGDDFRPWLCAVEPHSQSGNKYQLKPASLLPRDIYSLSHAHVIIFRKTREFSR